jgi:hypothetical protein
MRLKREGDPLANDTDQTESVPRQEFGIRKMELVNIIEGVKDEGRKTTSSVTLVKTPTSTVVVDSGARHVRDELVSFMRKNEAKVEKVNVLLTSRADEFHSGNDDLFVHCLQHVLENDWGKVPVKSQRKVAITTPVHWIDKFLKIVKLPFPEGESLALLAHFPDIEELLEPSTIPFKGQVVGITGISVPRKEDPRVKSALMKAVNMERPKGNIETMEELLAYCDFIIPSYGPMFRVRG